MKKLFLYKNQNFKRLIEGQDILKKKINFFSNWLKFLKKLKKEKKILIIFISGETTTGKSTWAIELCKRLGIRNLIHTDIVREFERLKSKKTKDPINFSSYQVYKAYSNKFSTKNLNKGFIYQSQKINKIIKRLIYHSSEYGKITLIEGINIMPSIVKKNYSSYYFINFHLTHTNTISRKKLQKDRFEYNYLNRDINKYKKNQKQFDYLKEFLFKDSIKSNSTIIYVNDPQKMLYEFIYNLNKFIKKL